MEPWQQLQPVIIVAIRSMPKPRCLIQIVALEIDSVLPPQASATQPRLHATHRAGPSRVGAKLSPLFFSQKFCLPEAWAYVVDAVTCIGENIRVRGIPIRLRVYQ